MGETVILWVTESGNTDLQRLNGRRPCADERNRAIRLLAPVRAAGRWFGVRLCIQPGKRETVDYEGYASSNERQPELVQCRRGEWRASSANLNRAAKLACIGRLVNPEKDAEKLQL